MKTIIQKGTNPYFNLALEEYLLKEFSLHEDVFYLWRNEPCIVIGRNQNPFNEIHLLKANERQIPVIRRISGGGSVYHDLGNINFTYITTNVSKNLNNYKYFLRPIINILEKVGLPVRFVESSHIYLGDTKISGNAQSFHKNKMIHHGTLLFDTDLSVLRDVIKQKKAYETHAVDSVRAKTTNIKDALQMDVSIHEFMDFLLSEMFLEGYQNNIITLSEDDKNNVLDLAKTKYETWDWNFGETPEFWINKKINNEITQLKITKGIVVESSVCPEYLEGCRFDEKTMRKALKMVPNSESLIQELLD